MICDPRLLSYYRDGVLSFDERYELERHLADCADCTASLRGLMRLAQVVRSLPMEPVSPTLRYEVRRLVAARDLERRRRPAMIGGLGRSLAPAALAASIAVSALVVFRPGALELPNRPAPVAVSSESAADQLGAQPAEATGLASSAQASQPAETTGPAVAVQASQPDVNASGSGSAEGPVRSSAVAPPSRHLPVSQAGADSLPIKLGNPAVVPEPIARLYGTNQQIHDLLGVASPGSRTVTLLEQSFQGGLAIWRGDTRQIYVLRRDGNTWSVHSDTWRPGDRIAVDSAPPPGAMVPSAGFGTVWRSTPEIKSRLGWAVYEPRGSAGAIQTFEHGLVVWTPHGLLYVLSNDGRWRTFPDATTL